MYRENILALIYILQRYHKTYFKIYVYNKISKFSQKKLKIS